MDPHTPKYRRVMLKISGEGFCGPTGFGIDGDQIERIAGELRDVVALGVELAVVVGGGNFLRGSTVVQGTHIQPATGHYMGMMATLLNGLALQDTLEHLGIEVRLQSAIPVRPVCEPLIRRRAIRHLEKGRVVILAAGTGNPFVTTDTSAALRAVEVNADVVLKATKVDGVYSADPHADPSAIRYERLTFNEAIEKRLRVMDVSAFDLCQENNIPVIVFDMQSPGQMVAAVCGEPVGTLVTT